MRQVDHPDASDGRLSTSGIEGVLAGEETVWRFVEAWGATSTRPWLNARNRVAKSRPEAPRVREELEALRARNDEFAA